MRIPNQKIPKIKKLILRVHESNEDCINIGETIPFPV